MRHLGLAILAVVSLLPTAEGARACTGEQPTFAAAIAGASAIARVVVEDELEDLILATLPDTATHVDAGSDVAVLGGSVLLGAACILSRRVRAR